MPTLMVKGKLVAPMNNAELQKELDTYIPYKYILEWFNKRLNLAGIENKVLILKSETASGKSTLLPPEIYKEFLYKKRNIGSLICTQPRVLTAIGNVKEMLKFNTKVLKMGDNIGWSTKHNKFRPKNVGLLSATVGTLDSILSSSTDEEIIKKFRFILIDETHERDLQTDMTLYKLKNLLIRNSNNPLCPFVVLMSATFEPDKFIKYFNVDLMSNFIWCVGEAAGFDEMWDWNEGRTVNNYTQYAAKIVEKIVNENQDDPPEKADILIFMPGIGEFAKTISGLIPINKKLFQENKKVFTILQLDSVAVTSQNMDYRNLESIPIHMQSITIMGKKVVPSRRVIISTVVAETGLTLANLKYVIDSGFNKEVEFNPIHGINSLLTKPAPKSRVIQRKGRAGRKFRGVFYPLYPRYIYDRLPELQYPSILISDISQIMTDIINEQLKVKTMAGKKNPEFIINDIDMVDIPNSDSLYYSINKLYSLGYLSPISPIWDTDKKVMLEAKQVQSFGLTKLGLLANTIGLISPELSRMIFAGFAWDCPIMDLITIAAYVGMGSKSFVQKINSEDEIKWFNIYKLGLPSFMHSNALYEMRLIVADSFIDGLILLNAIKTTINVIDPKKIITDLKIFCSNNNLKYKACLDFIKARDEIIDQLLVNEIDVFYMENNSLQVIGENEFMEAITKIKYCIYDGFRNNLLIKKGENYVTTTNLDVKSPKFFQENEKKKALDAEFGFATMIQPKYLIYNSLSMKYNFKTSLYVIVVDDFSSTDGIVNIDTEFTY
jgi:HrpA-like RNA helicase